MQKQERKRKQKRSLVTTTSLPHQLSRGRGSSTPARDSDLLLVPNSGLFKPEAWRAVTEEYSQKLMELACKLLGVLSEAMGLETQALTKACVDMDQKVVVHFYPKCPQPDLTLVPV
ncbi:2-OXOGLUTARATE (2OG) AND FE(II)-DEPENDENT OXYGENASE SUPERFAMILY PROTEIN-RELATED [Salix purpurea]|uniref:2-OXOGLUTARATE (2OG) AND FE(II)-DEPENDENT OXYGENASE SUPERFAMILY PROTEIN-RELATED n=1 Tax=Salix purpurea TaxID=77065 RepID=A0A9Q0WXH4_SALPP|nr:2-OXOGLUTARATE (2OG) AND FE(II)-DEPENDENT OXYGENASE SUPERFAMILY PROTEIN-RELATED [Salix purpurea]